MPRYKFHIFDDDQTIDREGLVFPDISAARDHAIRGARGLMAEDIKTKGRIKLSHWIEIEDEESQMIVVPFGEAVTISP